MGLRHENRMIFSRACSNCWCRAEAHVLSKLHCRGYGGAACVFERGWEVGIKKAGVIQAWAIRYPDVS